MHPLNYVTPRARRPSRSALGMFLVTLVVAPALLALGFVAVKRNVLPHDAVCPSCGGWGATLAVAATSSLLMGCFAVLMRTIRLPGTAGSITLATVTVALAALQVLVTIGFYLAIQM